MYRECRRRRRWRSLHDAPGIDRCGGHEGGMKMAEVSPSEMAANACKARAETKPAATRGFGHTFGLPVKQGLYDPRNEHDACGVGFVAHMKGEKSHQIVRDGLFMLENLTHRGAVGADPLMGDGAGILVQIPDRLFREEMSRQGVTLPEPGKYAVGFLFMPQDEALRDHLKGIIAEVVSAEGQVLLGFRDVPVDNSSLSKAPEIAATEPCHVQVFIGAGDDVANQDELERRLFVLRKVISNRVYGETNGRDDGFYFVSLSTQTIVYKGMFLAYQVDAYYADLKDPRFESAVALVHQRFSTNTFPSWPLAHPYRMICHNGEINTLRGNYNWMAARYATVSSTCSVPTWKSCGRFPMKASRTAPASTMRWSC
jgi:glutamate synthase (NADPH/NADH) large chain